MDMERPKEAALGWARRYQAGTQQVAPSAPVRLAVWERGDETLAPAGEEGLRLAAGRYLLGFTGDGLAENEREAGAVFALNGTEIPNTACTLGPGQRGRLALLTLLSLLAPGVITVVNPGRGELRCTNGELTVLRIQ